MSNGTTCDQTKQKMEGTSRGLIVQLLLQVGQMSVLDQGDQGLLWAT